MSVAAVFDGVFGGPPAKTEVADAIGRPIGAVSNSNGITITADAVIGDRNGYVLVYSVSRDNGMAFEAWSRSRTACCRSDSRKVMPL